MFTPAEPPAAASDLRSAGLPERLYRLVDALPDALLCLDRDWHITYANAEASRVSGLQAELSSTTTLWDLFPTTEGSDFARGCRRTMDARQPAHLEYTFRSLDVTVDIQALPTDEGIALYYRDITAQRKAETREKEQRQGLAQVFEATSDAIAVLDREWRYTFLNAHAQALIDPEDRLIGKNIWEEFPLAVGGPAWETYHRSMNQRVSARTEMYYPAPINRWLSLQSEPTPEGIAVFFRDITEQRTHDEVIGAQNELLAVVQSASRLATWDLDLSTQQILWGPGSFDIFGHPLASITSLDELTGIVVQSEEDLRCKIDAASRSKDMFVSEFAVRGFDGATIWVEARGQAVPRSDGAPRLRGMVIDITERKANYERLVASESRYRVLADLNPQAIWMGDAAGNVTYANQGFLAYIGLSPEDLSGMGWLGVFAPEDRERVVEVWTRSVTTGIDYDIEARIRNSANGEYRWWHLRAAPVRDSTGAILHWLGVGNDINDARVYAETLRAEQAETERGRAELETIYKTTPVGLALLDPVEFRFVNLNDHEAEMLGCSKEEILGRPLSEIAPIPGLLDLFRWVAGGNVIKDRLVEGELPSRPGELRAWSVNYSPIFNEDGTVRLISTASIEITNQKKAESALIRSEKLAAVGRLASSISHEINNPLEAITNLLYLIAIDDQMPPALKNYVHMAQSELSRVSQIATQTLRFHRQAVAPTLVSPADLVDAVIRLYTGRLANSNITVQARYSTDTKILCFENDIRQVLNNLIANAIDAMRNGGRIIVRAHAVHDLHPADCTPSPGSALPSAGGCPGVRITIADTGHGMSAAVLARLFEPFFTTKDLNGTGLGLWISRGIVERHQGRLSVRSSTLPQRHGTVFTLFLPCKEQVS